MKSNTSPWSIASTLLSILDPHPQLVSNKTTEKIFTITLKTSQIKTFWISKHKIKNCSPKLIFNISLSLICEYSFHKPIETMVLTSSYEFFTTMKPWFLKRVQYKTTTFNQVSTSISESLGQTFLGGVLGIQPPDSTWLLDPISCFLGELLTGLSAKISLVNIVSPLHFHTYLKGFLSNSTNSASWEKLRKWRKQKQAISDKENNAWVKYMSRKKWVCGKNKGAIYLQKWGNRWQTAELRQIQS